MKTLAINIVSAENSLFKGEATFLVASGIMGELGIYPGHMSLLTKLKPGQVRVTLDSGHEEVFWVSGGILEVQPNEVIILADAGERAADLDEALVVKATEEAKMKIKHAKDQFDIARATSELSEFTSKLDAISRLRKNSKRA